MSYEYAQKKRTPGQSAAPTHSGGAMETAVPNSARLAALESGQISPTAADKGHRVDLPEAMRAKMESSFGMDFSAVKLYESETLGQTGAEAMAQGNEIAFAPGKLDFASQSGQALLGHELSHIASQARGEVHGGGFLYDGGLEARADREGAMAARGESVFTSGYGGAVAPLSAASAAPMAGPMQASKGDKKDQDEGHGLELIENAPRFKKSGYGPKSQIGTASNNLKGYWKNYSQNVRAQFGQGKGHIHKDLVPGIAGSIYKNKVNKRMDEDMASMMRMDDEDLEIEEPTQAEGNYGAIPQIGTALRNTKEYAKNLGSNFLSLFSRNRKAELHKDFMSEKRKNKISDAADAETRQLRKDAKKLAMDKWEDKE